MTTNLARLTVAAQAASENAYCRYSNFRVGAAVLSASGRVFTGANVENRSYGLTCCAERTALFAMVTAGETEFQSLVIYTPTQTPTPPCGACREVMGEFSPDGKAAVHSVCETGEMLISTIGELLPSQFRL